MVTIKQGDAYSLPVSITVDGAPLASEDAAGVEFYIGTLRKVWPSDCTYEDGKFMVPLTQEETFAFEAGTEIEIDYRVKFVTGDVIGPRRKLRAYIADATSEVEL